jgi:hypothetical protein
MTEVPSFYKKTRLKYFGDRSFPKCAPVLGNQLPFEIKQGDNKSSFERKLKTHSFEDAYKFFFTLLSVFFYAMVLHLYKTMYAYLL